MHWVSWFLVGLVTLAVYYPYWFWTRLIEGWRVEGSQHPQQGEGDDL